MKCSKTPHHLIGYLDGTLDTTKHQEIEDHLNACASCRAFLQKIREALLIIENEKKTVFDPYMLTRVQAALDEAPQHHTWRSVLQPIFIAFLLLLVVYTGIAMGKNYSHQQVLANDYETELYYLSEMQDEHFETLLTLE